MKFDHVGITTDKEFPNQKYVEKTKVWITISNEHQFPIEWLRYEPDSTVPDSVKTTPHIGYIVDSIDKQGKDLNCIIEPFIVDNRKVAFYELSDGGIIELIEIIK
ncbi:MAG: hypothetical protein GX217_01250 [Clostridiaceae bacterium]|nr:hypothetical protein [Clostridiaceae bacterium]